MTLRRRGARDGRRERRADHSALALFSVMWALAAVWHLLGNTSWAPAWPRPAGGRAPASCSGARARSAPLALLAVAGLVTVWGEAPVLGNHWLLAGFVNLAILAGRGRRGDPGAVGRRGGPGQPAAPGRPPLPARLLRFARSPSSTPRSSTGRRAARVHYFRESTDSLGLARLQLDGAAWLQWVVIVGDGGRRAVHPGAAAPAGHPGPRRGAGPRLPRHPRHRPHPPVLRLLRHARGAVRAVPAARPARGSRSGSGRCGPGWRSSTSASRRRPRRAGRGARGGRQAVALDLLDADTRFDLGWWPWQLCVV